MILKILLYLLSAGTTTFFIWNYKLLTLKRCLIIGLSPIFIFVSIGTVLRLQRMNYSDFLDIGNILVSLMMTGLIIPMMRLLFFMVQFMASSQTNFHGKYNKKHISDNLKELVSNSKNLVPIFKIILILNSFLVLYGIWFKMSI